MMRNAKWALGSGLQLLGSECRDGRWTISAVGQGSARCPGCDVRSTRRHGWSTYGIRRFVHTLRLDLTAVRNAITETWSNGQTEGQINRLKMLKRAMYGRAGVDLLRARMIPSAPAT
jgi:transposase